MIVVFSVDQKINSRACAGGRGLYVNLIISGIMLTEDRVSVLADAAEPVYRPCLHP